MQRRPVSDLLNFFSSALDQLIVFLSLSFRLKHSLTTWGEKFTEKEWESMVSEAPMAGSGKIDIKKWAKIITGGGDDE